MRLKICGLTDSQNIKDVIGINPDYIGFIFYQKSKRYVGTKLNNDVILNIPKTIKKVGVFVNAELSEVISKINLYGLDLVQLHGDESPDYCLQIYQYARVIKSFGINEAFNFSVCKSYSTACNYFLFDTASKEYGGSGKTFDHNLLKNYKEKIPFFLSGGVGLAEAQFIKDNLNNKFLHAIDVNSRFENDLLQKDITQLKTLINILK